MSLSLNVSCCIGEGVSAISYCFVLNFVTSFYALLHAAS